MRPSAVPHGDSSSAPLEALAVVPSDRRVSPWPRAGVLLALVLAALVGLHRETGLAMVTIWDRSETFAHAWLVPPIVLWLIWRERADLARLTPQASPAMLLVLAGAAFAWLLSDLAAVNAGAQFAFVAMLVLAVPAVLGVQVAKRLMFPLGFAFFAVPAGEFTMPTLMAWTADFTVGALQLSGIPVYREGQNFVIPSGAWSVIEACSGVRYLIASLMVGTLFAFISYRSNTRRWLFVGVSILVPVVANWFRAYLIVMLGHLSGNKLAAGADHLIYGWVFFGLVIGVMFMIGARWSEAPAPAAVGADTRASRPPMRWGAMVAVAVAAVVIGALPMQLQSVIVAQERPGAPHLVAAEALADGWRSVALPVKFKPAFQAAPAELQAAYANTGAPVGVYIAYYRHQGGDSKLVNSQNLLVKSKDPDWVQTAGGTQTVEAMTVRTARFKRNDSASEQRLIAWQFYWVDGQWTTSDTVAKLRGAWQRLHGGGDDGAAVVLYVVDDGTPSADAPLAAFVRANLGVLQSQLTKVRLEP